MLPRPSPTSSWTGQVQQTKQKGEGGVHGAWGQKQGLYASAMGGAGTAGCGGLCGAHLELCTAPLVFLDFMPWDRRLVQLAPGHPHPPPTPLAPCRRHPHLHPHSRGAADARRHHGPGRPRRPSGRRPLRRRPGVLRRTPDRGRCTAGCQGQGAGRAGTMPRASLCSLCLFAHKVAASLQHIFSQPDTPFRLRQLLSSSFCAFFQQHVDAAVPKRLPGLPHLSIRHLPDM